LRRDLERRAARTIIYYVDRYGEVHVRYHSDSQTWDIRSSPSGNPAKVPGTAGRGRTEGINETNVNLILCPTQKSSSSWGVKVSSLIGRSMHWGYKISLVLVVAWPLGIMLAYKELNLGVFLLAFGPLGAWIEIRRITLRRQRGLNGAQ